MAMPGNNFRLKYIFEKSLEAMKSKNLKPIIFCLIFSAFLFSSCSNLRYTYYSKHKVPFSPSAEAPFVKAIPAKPFLAQTPAALKQKPLSAEQNFSAVNNPIRKEEKIETGNQPAAEKFSNQFDIKKYFKENQIMIRKGSGSGMDNRTLVIILIIVIALIIVGSVSQGLLWLIWVGLLALLILLLIKYFGLFG